MSFQNGFYINKKEDVINILQKIKSNKPVNNSDNIYYNAHLFLHGICHVFAYALHLKYGYQILELKNETGSMVHWCCISKYKGKKVYIDVRGITSDYNEFIDEFQPDIGERPIQNIITNLNNYEDEWDAEQLVFANEIISKYKHYYLFNQDDE